MKQRLHLVAFAVVTMFAAGCISQSGRIEPGVEFKGHSDPYMYWICEYYKDANSRWPSNTTELVRFLRSDYTNMLDEVEHYYGKTDYTVTPEGWLILDTRPGHGERDKKYIGGERRPQQPAGSDR